MGTRPVQETLVPDAGRMRCQWMPIPMEVEAGLLAVCFLRTREAADYFASRWHEREIGLIRRPEPQRMKPLS